MPLGFIRQNWREWLWKFLRSFKLSADTFLVVKLFNRPKSGYFFGVYRVEMV